MKDFEGDFEIFAHYLNPTDAHVICSCLVAGGVSAMVADANLVQMNDLWAVAVGGVRILVLTSQMTKAREIIEAFERGDLALSENDELS